MNAALYLDVKNKLEREGFVVSLSATDGETIHADDTVNGQPYTLESLAEAYSFLLGFQALQMRGGAASA